MDYRCVTEQDRRQMLESMGLPGDDIERVYEVIPEKLRATAFELPEGRSEYAVDRECRSLAAANASDIVPFLGGGYYDHFIPSAVDEIASRSEFYTAYTPYQAEASQGTLQAIYEFQSCVAGLTSLDVANASLYDGGTAVYEAVMMAARVTRNSRVVVDECVSPIYREMLYCYTANLPVEVVEVPRAGYQTDHDGIKNALDDDTAAVVVQYPNFFGSLDDFEDVVQACHIYLDGYGMLEYCRRHDLPLVVNSHAVDLHNYETFTDGAKRRLREVARLDLPGNARPGWDYVLIGRRGATASLDFQQMRHDLQQALCEVHS